MSDLKDKGIDIDDITQQLEDEGIEEFNKACDELLESIGNQKHKKS